MSFGGHVLDSIRRIESNRRLRKASSSRMRARREAVLESSSMARYNSSAVLHKSKEEELMFKKALLYRNRKKEIRTWTLTLFLFLLVVLVSYLYWTGFIG